jgi:uncharacterized protein (DUF1800 family)
MAITNMTAAAIALNRFGLGFSFSFDSSTKTEENISDAKSWLISQLTQYQAKPSAWANQTSTTDLLADSYQQKKQTAKASEMEKKAANQRMRKDARDEYNDAVNRRTESALTSNTPFVERLVHFWANHFAISAEKPAISDLAGAFELEAIRAHVLGNFKNMLFAVEQHPAMLLFLDQAKSIGPNSPTASKMQKKDPSKTRGLNENLAREILELHTLGVKSGYTQTDVTEFARAMTGWSVAGDANNNKIPNQKNQKNKRARVITQVTSFNGFEFRPQLHEPGSRNILGKTYAQTGQAQAEAILNDLALHQATAKHIATKLARHFVADNPPASLVDKLSQAYLQSAGNLTAVYRVLIESDEAWQPAPAKFKTPWEWLVSGLRGMGKQSLNNINVAQILNQLGQPIWKPGSPAGFDDIAATWAAPNALLRRVEMAQRLAGQMGDKLDARSLGDKILLGSISAETKTAIERAESATTALALLLVSPEFLRR